MTTNELPEVNVISMIDTVNLQTIQQTMQKISSFQAIVQKTLKPNHDYGIIPGTGTKPTLLKPGAEKILMLFGLTSEFEEIERVQDYENGFFAFTIKCILSKNGLKVTEGVGHANTREKKYAKQDPYSIANTILKMAKKRSLIDATLTVAALSEIFTQDLEDDIEGTPVEQSIAQNRQYTDTSGTITQKQAKRMFALANGDNDLVKNIIGKYGYEHSTDVKKTDYEKICNEIETATQADLPEFLKSEGEE
ncbi:MULTISPECIES: hypothetical protein [Thermoanaerobacterium]|uniref:ERF family protein n=2 Tax=Thermoanaerobacterium TaxID=28895 RepID=W9E9Q2_9THEO|nr:MULTISPECIES: hypothetical protein [Thermoanaerobacterium]AFK87440.1 hypothetical protein Tsac_2442 [Thermoanaerobacterium saccharolyticum JW/SL-YS485]ETO37811.1 hypothetical protein V518_2065 [Thermoanaerobacterium aotearoense SCUT27]